MQCQSHRCEDCGKIYGQRKSLFRHRNTCAEVHLSPRRWICGVCGESFSRADVRQRHVNEQHHHKGRKDVSKRGESASNDIVENDIYLVTATLGQPHHPTDKEQIQSNTGASTGLISAAHQDELEFSVLDDSNLAFSRSLSNRYPEGWPGQLPAPDPLWPLDRPDDEDSDMLNDQAAVMELSLQDDSGIDLSFDDQAFGKHKRIGPPANEILHADQRYFQFELFCPICGLLFETEAQPALNHLKLHFKEFDTCSACNVCHVTFRREEDLLKHLRSAETGCCGYEFQHSSICTGHHTLVQTSSGTFWDEDRIAFIAALRSAEQDVVNSLVSIYCRARSKTEGGPTAPHWNICAGLGQSLSLPIAIPEEPSSQNSSNLTFIDGLSELDRKDNASPTLLLRARRPVRSMSAFQMQESLLFAASEGNLPRVDSILCSGGTLNVRAHYSDAVGNLAFGQTPLALAALNGHLPIVQRMLRSEADPNFGCSDGQTPLHLASSSGHQEIVLELLQSRADVLAKDSLGETALNKSIFNFPDIAEMLLEHGIDVDSKTNDGCYLLEKAVRLNDTRAIRLLLRYGAEPNLTVVKVNNMFNQPFEDALKLSDRECDQEISPPPDESPVRVPILQQALAGEFFAAAEVLLNFGAKVDVPIPGNSTMLQSAMDSGSLAAAKLLLNYGANPCEAISEKVSVTEQAFQKSSWSAVIFLLNHAIEFGGNVIDERRSILHEVKIHLPQTADLLWKNGADIIWFDSQRGLQYPSVALGDPDLVLRLLISGVVIDEDGGDLSVALCYASAVGNTEVGKGLLARGADINSIGGPMGNALCHACRFGHFQTIQMLIAHGGDINHVGDNYGSLLNVVAGGREPIYNRSEIAIALLEAGVDVNLSAGTHGPALYDAAYCGRSDLVQLLLNRGANVNQCGGKLGSPLCAAATKGYVDVVRLLLKHIWRRG